MLDPCCRVATSLFYGLVLCHFLWLSVPPLQLVPSPPTTNLSHFLHTHIQSFSKFHLAFKLPLLSLISKLIEKVLTFALQPRVPIPATLLKLHAHCEVAGPLFSPHWTCGIWPSPFYPLSKFPWGCSSPAVLLFLCWLATLMPSSSSTTAGNLSHLQCPSYFHCSQLSICLLTPNHPRPHLSKLCFALPCCSCLTSPALVFLHTKWILSLALDFVSSLWVVSLSLHFPLFLLELSFWTINHH